MSCRPAVEQSDLHGQSVRQHRGAAAVQWIDVVLVTCRLQRAGDGAVRLELVQQRLRVDRGGWVRRRCVRRRHAGAVGLHREREDVRTREGHDYEECVCVGRVRSRPAEAEQHSEERLVFAGGEDV